jgi:FkbM family methyltransferase
MLLTKLGLYLRSAVAQRGLNLRGMPIIPRSLWPSVPYHRLGYNQFVLWLKRLQLSRVNQVVDVGANHGDFAQAASTLFSNAKVLLVEPLPTLHPELERRCQEWNGRWSLAKCALGSQSGTATLHVDPHHDAIGSLLGFSEEYLKVNPTAREEKTITCAVRTLDELCTEHGIQTIDLLKIDVEGFEFETLKGAATMLRATNALVLEFSLVRRGEDKDALVHLMTVLRDAGLRVVELYPALYSPEATWLPVEFNLLARRV